MSRGAATERALTLKRSPGVIRRKMFIGALERIVAALSFALIGLTPARAVVGGSLPEPQLLEKGKPVEKALAVSEAHVYLLALGANQSVTVRLEKRGVAVVTTLLAPNGEKLGTFGSNASREGTDQIVFSTESAGSYRIIVRTFFKPSPPGNYQIGLVDVHATSDKEKSGRASRHCEEKSWLDRDNNFLVNEALESISRCMTAVGQRLDASSPKAPELAGEANAEVRYLIGRWHWGEFVSPAYQENLVQDFRVLAAASAEPDAKKAISMMKEVAEDLKIKADHCRKSNRGLGEDVTVRVKTRNEAREEAGWAVYYKLGIFQFAKGHMADRFPELSSPTRHRLPAGRYLMWVGKPGHPEPSQERQERVSIGDGAREMALDLMIP